MAGLVVNSCKQGAERSKSGSFLKKKLSNFYLEAFLDWKKQAYNNNATDCLNINQT